MNQFWGNAETQKGFIKKHHPSKKESSFVHFLDGFIETDVLCALHFHLLEVLVLHATLDPNELL